MFGLSHSCHLNVASENSDDPGRKMDAFEESRGPRIVSISRLLDENKV
jgi:hypothetical protein